MSNPSPANGREWVMWIAGAAALVYVAFDAWGQWGGVAVGLIYAALALLRFATRRGK